MGQLESIKPGRKPEQLAGLGRLRTRLNVGGAQEGAIIVDRHGGGGVVDGRDVGIGDVYGEDEFGVDDGEVDLEGGKVDRYEVKCRVFGLGSD